MKTYSVREDISKELDEEFAEFPELARRLLAYRGITTRDEAEAFLSPNYEAALHDPFLMHGMKKAVARVLNAIEKKEHIVIYSDYDCDGIPGGVILHDFFKKIGYEHFSNYIPHRHEEGYGLNISAIEKAAENNAKLLITVDCGIADRVPVDRANELGIDVIITDHHLENGKLPKAYAVLNPNQKADKTYPFKGLCGAGVAFKLVQGLIMRGDFSLVTGWEKWLLDMAGLSTMTDMVPLQDENRVISYYGLHVLRKSRRPGLQQLCRTIRVDQRTITEDDIGFMIGPRINAASRMDHPIDAFNLLRTDDVTEGGKLSEYLDKLNRERRALSASMTKEIKARLRRQDDIRDVIVMGNPLWRPSNLGLVANGVVETYNRPVFLWGRDSGGLYKGSCRRPDDGVNLVEFMTSIKDTFIDAGGHSFSGGFSVIPEKIHHFEEIINDAYKKFVKKLAKKEPEVLVDKKMDIRDVTWETYRTIEQFAPFGVGNEKPIFLFEHVEIAAVEHFGKEKNHLRLRFVNENGKDISAIAFFKTIDHFDATLEQGKRVNLVASFEKSTFGGRTELRLRIVDVY